MQLLMRCAVVGAALALSATTADARDAPARQTIIPLYADSAVSTPKVPERRVTLPTGEQMIFDVSTPTLELFRPPAGRGNGTAMIVAPGGGFVGLGYRNGGTEIARQLAQNGITAFVLKYRTIRSMPDPMQLPETHRKEMDVLMSRARTGVPALVPPFAGERDAVEDGTRAIAIVRTRAAEWGVDPKRVGMIGFSAGAFLAVDLAIADRAVRPNFVALLYGGLRTPVPADASPAFIAAAADDEFQPDDAVQLYSGWRKAGASAELHLYARGGHGFDLTPQGTTSDLWFEQLLAWMRARNLLPKTAIRAAASLVPNKRPH